MHFITLSFDDGFRKSNLRIAEIYERFGLSACFNVIATGHHPCFAAPDAYHIGYPKGDFVLWNELQARGHEIMPHGWRHANKRRLPLSTAKDYIRRCLDIFAENLRGFDPRRAVFNFPYNASSPEIEAWLPSVVRAYRTGGAGINPLPDWSTRRLTCTAFGPGNCERHLTQCLEALLSRPRGWLIYNTHGLDDEGWGPIRASYLENLLARLARIPFVRLLPAGKALA